MVIRLHLVVQSQHFPLIILLVFQELLLLLQAISILHLSMPDAHSKLRHEQKSFALFPLCVATPVVLYQDCKQSVHMFFHSLYFYYPVNYILKNFCLWFPIINR